MMKTPLAVAMALSVAGCAVQRAQVAADARTQMLGLKREQVLACMGAPVSRAAEGATEVWTYNSGDGTIIGTATVWGDHSGGISTISRRFCVVNIVMSGGEVQRVNYLGPTGGLITAGEQCAFAVQACVAPR